MKKLVAGACIALFLAGNAFSQEVLFSGNLGTVFGAYAPGTEKVGDYSVGNISVTGTVDAYAGDSSAFIEGSVDYDVLTDSLHFALSEAYIDYSSSFWGMRFGLQKVAWGKADGISITDSVFPKDSSSLFVDDDVVAIKAARFSVNGSWFTVDGYVIPVFTGTKLPVHIDSLSSPALKFSNMEYGMKASGYFPVCDISLYGFYGWDKTPVLSYQLNPALGSLAVTGEYKRLAMVGFDTAIPVGPFVVRTETAFFPEREMQSSSKAIMSGASSSIKQQQVMALAGFDWMSSSWTVTAQYYCDAVLNASADTERTESYEHGATFSVSKSILNDTLELSLSGVVGLNCLDSAITGSAEYSLSDQIGLSLGTCVFLPGPDKKGTYGAYKDYSSVYVKAEYRW